jgi:hypothetical protein
MKKTVKVFDNNTWYIPAGVPTEKVLWWDIESDNINTSALMVITDAQMYSMTAPVAWCEFWNSDRKTTVVRDWTSFVESTGKIIYNEIFSEKFESWDLSSRTVVNWTETNKRTVWTDEKFVWTYWAYISADLWVTAGYDNTDTAVVHFYKDIAIPVGIADLQISFKWKCLWEAGANDYFRISKCPTSITPTVNNLLWTWYRIWATQYNDSSIWNTTELSLWADDAGTTIRVVFTRRNNNNSWENPAACIDNIFIWYV